MQYALVDGERREASRGLIGFCQGCDQPMIPKCGPIKAPHWAHRSEGRCDPWWENETPWHRAWKQLFPAISREVRQYDANSECHIADIRTEHGLVIECQHSSISAEEIQSREKFYGSVGSMVWVVDGTRYKRGIARLSLGQESWGRTPLPWLFTSSRPEESFSTVWLNCSVPVFFDFEVTPSAEASIDKNVTMWCLLPDRIGGHAVIARVARQYFISQLRCTSEVFPYSAVISELTGWLEQKRRDGVRGTQPIPAWLAAQGRRRRRIF